jgi:hypothetical protein
MMDVYGEDENGGERRFAFTWYDLSRILAGDFTLRHRTSPFHFQKVLK